MKGKELGHGLPSPGGQDVPSQVADSCKESWWGRVRKDSWSQPCRLCNLSQEVSFSRTALPMEVAAAAACSCSEVPGQPDSRTAGQPAFCSLPVTLLKEGSYGT